MIQRPTLTLDEMRKGKVFLIDKPYEWTSFGVVKKVRGMICRHYGVRKFKVGHAGTLDPLATGLLVICVGRATKEISGLQETDKAYSGTFKLGATTPSFDRETREDQLYGTQDLKEESIYKAAEALSGEQFQRPPIFSAKRIAGRRAFESARTGEKVVMPPYLVWVHRFEVTHIALPYIDVLVSCSKGTYVRALARDMGKALGCGAYLVALRRIQCGEFTIDEALTIDQFRNWLAAE